MTGYLDTFDWSRFAHGLGPATDTPGHLRALLGDDAGAFVAGYSHLRSQTLRPDGGAWPVTAPVALVVSELLDDPRLGPDDPSMRDAMLAYLHRAAVAGDLGEEAEALRARGEQPEALACYDAAPELLARVLPHLGAERSRQRVCAAAAIGRLARHPAAATRRRPLTDQLDEMAKGTEEANERATLVFAIGDLGGTPRHWLDDPSPAVRGCAALAATLADDQAATDVLLALGRSPRAFAASLHGLAGTLQFMVPPYPDLIAETLVQRVDDPRKLLPCAFAAVVLPPRSAARSLAPYLRAIFPDGDPRPEPRPHQRVLARAIAEREELWSLPEKTLTGLFAPYGLSARRADWYDAATRGIPADAGYEGAIITVHKELTSLIRLLPRMYFGVDGADPSVPDRAARSLRSEYTQAVAAGRVESFTVEIESPTRLVLDVRGHDLDGTRSADRIDLDHVLARLSPSWPDMHVSITSAICKRVGVQVWCQNRALARDYADGTALDATKALGTDSTCTGYRLTFDLDTDWLPAASRFSSSIEAVG